jgi:S1-C subfamily serine protease
MLLLPSIPFLIALAGDPITDPVRELPLVEFRPTSPFRASAALPDPDDDRVTDRELRIRAATVRVEARQDGLIRHGSGVLACDGEFVLTAWHVVAGARSVEVRTVGRRRFTPVSITRFGDHDVAILRLGEEARELGDLSAEICSAGARPGTAALACGNTGGRGLRMIRGVVGNRASVAFQGKVQPFDSLIAAVESGDSGTGVFDERTGKLVGILVAKATSGPQVGYFVELQSLLREESVVERKGASNAQH